jgi:hypothetical protein
LTTSVSSSFVDADRLIDFTNALDLFSHCLLNSETPLRRFARQRVRKELPFAGYSVVKEPLNAITHIQLLTRGSPVGPPSRLRRFGAQPSSGLPTVAHVRWQA